MGLYYHVINCALILQTFMEKVVEECSSDTDYVWIHDYHLLVLPSLLRKRFNKIRWAVWLETAQAAVAC